MMRRSLCLIAAMACLWAADTAISPRTASAQADPATQRLIDQLRPRMGSGTGTRGLMRPPQSAEPTGEPGPAGALTSPAARPPSRPPVATTTAPPDVPAASITVNFSTGSAMLLPGAFAPLHALGQALSSPTLSASRFRIEGHTDTVGSAEENRALSERRATTVRDFLIERFRIDPARIVTQGLGESQLLVATPDETSQARNRRVQVVNIGS